MYIKNGKTLYPPKDDNTRSTVIYGEALASEGVAVSSSYEHPTAEPKVKRRTTGLNVRRVVRPDSGRVELQISVEVCDQYEHGQRTMHGSITLFGAALTEWDRAHNTLIDNRNEANKVPK